MQIGTMKDLQNEIKAAAVKKAVKEEHETQITGMMSGFFKNPQQAIKDADKKNKEVRKEDVEKLSNSLDALTKMSKDASHSRRVQRKMKKINDEQAKQKKLE